MFVDRELWRQEFRVDDLYREFLFEEREAVNKYYPQYHHKTDKVSSIAKGRS
jgi:phosphatidylinositol/phosphatidylcholine transfer protein